MSGDEESDKKALDRILRNRMLMEKEFTFLDPGQLIDNELELVLIEKYVANPMKDYPPAYVFDMRNTEIGEKMGSIQLRIGNNENLFFGGHIGYGVDEKFRGNHFAARSVKLLFPLAKRHGFTGLWITCNPENITSRKTCELAGGKLVEIVDLPPHNEQYLLSERQKCRYRFDLQTY